MTMTIAVMVIPHPLFAIALLSHSQFRAVTVYAIPDMNRFFSEMNAPVIETIVVMTRAKSGSAVNSPKSLFLKNGIIFIMSRTMMKNIMKTMKKTIVSRTVISVDSLWRFSPKKPPISVCHTGDIVTVPFHGFCSLNSLRLALASGLFRVVFS